MALATGFADKSVSLYLETLFRKAPSERWLARCREQIGDTLDLLDADRAKRASSWWLGETLSHADIAAGCALCHLREAHPDFFDPKRWPNLAAHAMRTDALEEFREIYQPFVVNMARPA